MKKRKPWSITFSPQAKVFLETCNPEDRDSLLNLLEKIVKGEVRGKPLNFDTLPEEAKRAIEADDRGRKPKPPRS